MMLQNYVKKIKRLSPNEYMEQLYQIIKQMGTNRQSRDLFLHIFHTSIKDVKSQESVQQLLDGVIEYYAPFLGPYYKISQLSKDTLLAFLMILLYTPYSGEVSLFFIFIYMTQNYGQLHGTYSDNNIIMRQELLPLLKFRCLPADTFVIQDLIERSVKYDIDNYVRAQHTEQPAFVKLLVSLVTPLINELEYHSNVVKQICQIICDAKSQEYASAPMAYPIILNTVAAAELSLVYANARRVLDVLNQEHSFGDLYFGVNVFRQILCCPYHYKCYLGVILGFYKLPGVEDNMHPTVTAENNLVQQFLYLEHMLAARNINPEPHEIYNYSYANYASYRKLVRIYSRIYEEQYIEFLLSLANCCKQLLHKCNSAIFDQYLLVAYIYLSMLYDGQKTNDAQYSIIEFVRGCFYQRAAAETESKGAYRGYVNSLVYYIYAALECQKELDINSILKHFSYFSVLVHRKVVNEITAGYIVDATIFNNDDIHTEELPSNADDTLLTLFKNNCITDSVKLFEWQSELSQASVDKKPIHALWNLVEYVNGYLYFTHAQYQQFIGTLLKILRYSLLDSDNEHSEPSADGDPMLDILRRLIKKNFKVNYEWKDIADAATASDLLERLVLRGKYKVFVQFLTDDYEVLYQAFGIYSSITNALYPHDKAITNVSTVQQDEKATTCPTRYYLRLCYLNSLRADRVNSNALINALIEIHSHLLSVETQQQLQVLAYFISNTEIRHIIAVCMAEYSHHSDNVILLRQFYAKLIKHGCFIDALERIGSLAEEQLIYMGYEYASYLFDHTLIAEMVLEFKAITGQVDVSAVDYRSYGNCTDIDEVFYRLNENVEDDSGLCPLADYLLSVLPAFSELYSILKYLCLHLGLLISFIDDQGAGIMYYYECELDYRQLEYSYRQCDTIVYAQLGNGGWVSIHALSHFLAAEQPTLRLLLLTACGFLSTPICTHVNTIKDLLSKSPMSDPKVCMRLLEALKIRCATRTPVELNMLILSYRALSFCASMFYGSVHHRTCAYIKSAFYNAVENFLEPDKDMQRRWVYYGYATCILSAIIGCIPGSRPAPPGLCTLDSNAYATACNSPTRQREDCSDYWTVFVHTHLISGTMSDLLGRVPELESRTVYFFIRYVWRLYENLQSSNCPDNNELYQFMIEGAAFFLIAAKKELTGVFDTEDAFLTIHSAYYPSDMLIDTDTTENYFCNDLGLPEPPRSIVVDYGCDPEATEAIPCVQLLIKQIESVVAEKRLANEALEYIVVSLYAVEQSGLEDPFWEVLVEAYQHLGDVVMENVIENAQQFEIPGEKLEAFNRMLINLNYMQQFALFIVYSRSYMCLFYDPGAPLLNNKLLDRMAAWHFDQLWKSASASKLNIRRQYVLTIAYKAYMNRAAEDVAATEYLERSQGRNAFQLADNRVSESLSHYRFSVDVTNIDAALYSIVDAEIRQGATLPSPACKTYEDAPLCASTLSKPAELDIIMEEASSHHSPAHAENAIQNVRNSDTSRETTSNVETIDDDAYHIITEAGETAVEATNRSHRAAGGYYGHTRPVVMKNNKPFANNHGGCQYGVLLSTCLTKTEQSTLFGSSVENYFEYFEEPSLTENCAESPVTESQRPISDDADYLSKDNRHASVPPLGQSMMTHSAMRYVQQPTMYEEGPDKYTCSVCKGEFRQAVQEYTVELSDDDDEYGTAVVKNYFINYDNYLNKYMCVTCARYFIYFEMCSDQGSMQTFTFSLYSFARLQVSWLKHLYSSVDVCMQLGPSFRLVAVAKQILHQLNSVVRSCPTMQKMLQYGVFWGEDANLSAQDQFSLSQIQQITGTSDNLSLVSAYGYFDQYIASKKKIDPNKRARRPMNPFYHIIWLSSLPIANEIAQLHRDKQLSQYAVKLFNLIKCFILYSETCQACQSALFRCRKCGKSIKPYRLDFVGFYLQYTDIFDITKCNSCY